MGICANKQEKVYHSHLANLAEGMLARRIEGYTYEETTTHVKVKKEKDGTEILAVVGMTKITRHVPSSEKLICWALRVLRPEVYGDRTIALNLNVRANPYDKLSIEEIEAQIKEIELLNNKA